MKNQQANKYFIGWFIGIILCIVFYVIWVAIIFFTEPIYGMPRLWYYSQLIISSLGTVGTVFISRWFFKRLGKLDSPRLQKLQEKEQKKQDIEKNDERNKAIISKALAKTFIPAMIINYLLLHFLVLMNVEKIVFIVFSAAYLAVVILFLILWNKYNKEM